MNCSRRRDEFAIESVNPCNSALFNDVSTFTSFFLKCILPWLCHRLEWDGKASLISNYKSMGIVANPNVVGARSGTRHVVQLVSLQKPLSAEGDEQYGSDDEPDGKLNASLNTWFRVLYLENCIGLYKLL